MKKLKKLLCLLLTFLLVLTSISFSTAKVKAESDIFRMKTMTNWII